jgi:hypothetical protein
VADALTRSFPAGYRIGQTIPRPGPRAAGAIAFLAVSTAAVAELAARVPLFVRPLAPVLSASMGRVAAAAAAVVLAADLVVLLLAFASGQSPATGQSHGRFPEGLRLRTARLRGAVVTGAASLGLLLGSGALGLPLWGMALCALAPWLPLCASELSWRYRHYGFYAFFVALTILQLGHLGEHVAQNVQLLATGGDLAQSHGIFGQLDVETVHYAWQMVIWLGTGLLLIKVGKRNVWLWVAFVLTSLHSVEHLYFYWLYVFDPRAYANGGWNGILAQGGLIGSQLARPYLHLLYNLYSVVPFVLAFWDQSRLVYDRGAGGRQALSS